MLLAESGKQGLEILERQMVDVVISDMRMPEMSGAEFLAEVAERWPDTVRIVLTGFADMDATIKAVNEGKIFRYMQKPWEPDQLKETIGAAMKAVYELQLQKAAMGRSKLS